MSISTSNIATHVRFENNLLLTIRSGAKYSPRVYVEGSTDVLCNLRGSLRVVSDLTPVDDMINRSRYVPLPSSTEPSRLEPPLQISQLEQYFVSVLPSEESVAGRLTLEIVRPKSGAPFRNTMSFVNGDQADFRGVYHLNKAFVVEPFRGDISTVGLR